LSAATVDVVASTTVNGMTIEYEDEGRGDPLVLVMGLGEQLTTWPDELVAMFVGAGFRVIRFDNRDIGLSSEIDWTPPSQVTSVVSDLFGRTPETAYLLRDMADDTAGLLDALGVETAHVVGVSMGGMIAQELAIGHPERVSTLTSVMSNTGDRTHGKPKPTLVAKMARLGTPTRETAVQRSVDVNAMIAGPHYDAPARRELAERNVARSFRPRAIARHTAAVLASPDRTAALGRLTMPTLVVHGLLDPLVRPSGGVATARAVPHSRLLMYPDMAHDLPRPRWEELVAEVRHHADRAA
jgi:pimeloyl-ACP methyl ester carboxylesterase